MKLGCEGRMELDANEKEIHGKEKNEVKMVRNKENQLSVSKQQYKGTMLTGKQIHNYK